MNFVETDGAGPDRGGLIDAAAMTSALVNAFAAAETSASAISKRAVSVVVLLAFDVQ